MEAFPTGGFALQQTVITPLLAEPCRNEREVWNPEQAADEVSSTGIEERYTLQDLPVFCIRYVVWLKYCWWRSRKAGIYQEVALINVNLAIVSHVELP